MLKLMHRYRGGADTGVVLSHTLVPLQNTLNGGMLTSHSARPHARVFYDLMSKCRCACRKYQRSLLFIVLDLMLKYPFDATYREDLFATLLV